MKANEFANHIAPRGGRDFMRPISQDMYGIPRERVIGSSSTFAYTSDDQGGTITHKPRGRLPQPARRSLCGSGTRSADAGSSRPATRMVILRCWSSPTIPTGRPYGSSSCMTTQSENSTTRSGPSRHSAKAEADGWTVASIKNDWTAVSAS
jgi:hypothetical protein